MTTADNEGEPITEAGLVALRAEISELETVGRREIAARILTARGHGDLKENAEYHAAKEDQAHLETRILRLRQHWRNAVVVDVEEGPGVVFSFGRSAEAPVGKALLGHPAGATVEVPTPRGSRRLTIKRVL